MKYLIMLMFVSCAFNTKYNSDIYNQRCYNGSLYYVKYNDPELIYIPVFDNDGEKVRCSKTLGVDTKK